MVVTWCITRLIVLINMYVLTLVHINVVFIIKLQTIMFKEYISVFLSNCVHLLQLTVDLV